MTEREYNEDARPFLKWLGGKWAIREKIAALLPADYRERTYREPFLGGGAMFFHLQPPRAVLSDALAPLINLYEVIVDQPLALMGRIDDLRRIRGLDNEDPNSRARYDEERARFNAHLDGSVPLFAHDLAACFLYLNKMGFNGLCRFNGKGVYNTPYGKAPDRAIYDAKTIRACSEVLLHATIMHTPYDYLLGAVKGAKPGDVIYMDPPYVPISPTATFTGYDGKGWSADQDEYSAHAFRVLSRRGCLCVLSNSDTPLVRALYDDFDITAISAPRRVSATSTSAVTVGEVVIRNVKDWPAGALRA